MKKCQKAKERPVNPTWASFLRLGNKVGIGACIQDGQGKFVLANIDRVYHPFLILIQEKR
jgi:hypothetical protein